jgi:hypothetical protein
VNQRPASGVTPNVGNRLADARADVTRAGLDWPPTFTAAEKYAPTFENDRLRSRNSRNSAASTGNWSKPNVGNWLVISTSWPGSGYGNGRRITPLTTLKMAVLAPMPNARVKIAMAAKPGERTSVRTA